MRRWPGRAIAAVVMVTLTGRASGSGGPPPLPDYVTSAAASPVDQAALAAGRLGIMKGHAPAAILYLDWRLLNDLRVDAASTAALATPCCGQSQDDESGWLAARRAVPGASSDLYYVATDREGPNYTAIPTCFPNAFVTATATLQARIARHGAGSPGVRAWLAAQDAVFNACSKAGVTLPALSADAPAWLRADHSYQEAALALYDARLDEAERDFAEIGRDRSSPWQPMALYLQARVIQRRALDHPGADNFARAHEAIARLESAPAGTYGKGEVERMKQVLDYHEHPAALLARLDRALNDPGVPGDVAVKFKDYQSLSATVPQMPDAADWIATLDPKDRAAALAHARARWRASHRTAWLLAALSLAMPADADAGALVDDAARLPASDLGWLTARYHRMRLTIARRPPAELRAEIDAILARRDLTPSDRNIFLAVRAQSASGLADFAAHALRRPYCTGTGRGCVDGDWPAGDGLLGRQGHGYVGFGGDARAIIDRLPLAQRLALARDPSLPREQRLDLSLTNYARAALLQDDAAIDQTARALTGLLPQVRRDWLAIAATPPGPAKRFAEIFVMAKIPSLRTDLVDYARPEGSEPSFAGYWVDWLRVPAGGKEPTPSFPPAAAYMPQGFWDGHDGGAEPDESDLPCAGKCGAGTFSLHTPGFAAPLTAAALHERTHFLTDATVGSDARGARSLWEDALAFVAAHPNDPRAAETLYRLIRVARWGGNHDHLGRRAFILLHSRYAGSGWAKRSPFYYNS